MSEQTYTVNVHCKNCDYIGTMEFLKGKRCDGAHDCPQCECRELRKTP